MERALQWDDGAKKLLILLTPGTKFAKGSLEIFVSFACYLPSYIKSKLALSILNDTLGIILILTLSVLHTRDAIS